VLSTKAPDAWMSATPRNETLNSACFARYWWRCQTCEHKHKSTFQRRHAVRNPAEWNMKQCMFCTLVAEVPSTRTQTQINTPA